MVEVDGAKMFKSLHSMLSDEYKIAVVEKFGYGFSNATDKSKDIDTILENTREALNKLGIEAPYVQHIYA